MSPFVTGVLVLDAAWFGAGFTLFSVRSRRTATSLSPKGAGAEQQAVLAGLLRFLGGLNLALGVLCATVIGDHALFGANHAVSLVLVAVAVAHLSQVAVNVPIALAERSGVRGPWRVLRGIMLFIFAGDITLGLLSLAAGISLS